MSTFSTLHQSTTINPKIKDYYLLNSISLGGKSLIISEIDKKKLNVIFTQKEINLYVREKDGNLIAKESIVGGLDDEDDKFTTNIIPALIIY